MSEIELIIEEQLKGAYSVGPGSVIETTRRVAMAACAEQRKLCAAVVASEPILTSRRTLAGLVESAGTASLNVMTQEESV